MLMNTDKVFGDSNQMNFLCYIVFNRQFYFNERNLYFKCYYDQIEKYHKEVGLNDLCTHQAGMEFVLTENTPHNL